MSMDVSTLAVKVKSEGVDDLAKGLNKIFKEAKKAEDRVESLTVKIGKLSNMFNTGAASAKAYQEAIALANRSVGGHDKASSALTDAIKNLTKAVSTIADGMKNLEVKTKGSTLAIVSHTQAMQNAHDLARGLSGSLGALWLTYGNIAPMIAGVALGTAFKGVLSVGVELQNTMEGIRVKGVESMESIRAMTAAIKDLGQGVYGPKEVAKAFEDLILAGLSAEQALIGIKSAMNLAIVGGTSIEKASTTLVQVSTALDMGAEGFGRVADVIAKTAAVSMSSVDSLSEAFKSAASVGKLYKVSLVDIGTSLAGLSQLGIQNTAAGTALKNFYKELTTESTKLKNVLSSMHMVPADLKDADGNFLSLIKVVSKLSDGLDRLKGSAQSQAKIQLSNQQGLRQLVEVLDLYRTKTADGSNELVKFNEEIANSYGFVALGAAQMAMTVQNQFNSVKNTLQTSLGEAFDEIQPQVTLFASKMKETFASSEFKDGVRALSTIIAELALTLANNISWVIKFGEAFITWKALQTTVGVIKTLIEVFGGLKIIIAETRLAVIAFELSLGFIGIALVAAAGLWAYYNSKVHDNEAQAASLNNMQEFNKQLDSQIDHLKKVNEQLAKGIDLKHADQNASTQQALDLAEKNRDGVINAAQSTLNKAKGAYHDIPGFITKSALEEAQKNFDSAKALADKNVELSKQKQTQIQQLSKDEDTFLEAQAKKRAADDKLHSGSADLIGKNNGAAKAANDRYAAELLRIEADIEAAKRQLKYITDANEADFKAGLIGRLTLIQKNADAEIQTYQNEIANYNRMIETASPKDREAKKQELSNKMLAAEDGLIQATVKKHQQEAEYLQEVDKSITENAIKEAEAKGQYVLAAQLKYGELNRVAQAQIASDVAMLQAQVDATSEAGMIEAHRKAVDRLNKLKVLAEQTTNLITAQTTAAHFKEDLFAFDNIFKTAQAGIEELNEKASEGGGFFARLFSAEEVSNLKNSMIPQILEEVDKLKADMSLPGASDMDISNAENKIKNYYKFLNKQNDTYKETLKAVDDFMIEGFQAAMSHVDGAWSAFVKKLKDTFKNNLIEEIYRMFARPFVMQIIANFAGMAGFSGAAQAASTASGFAQGASLLSMGKTMWDGFQTGMTSSTGGFISSIGDLVGSSSITNFGNGFSAGGFGGAYGATETGYGTGATAAGQAGATAGSILATVTPAIIGQFVGRTISGGYSVGGGSSSTAVNAGTIIGAIAGGPIGAGIGAAIGGLVNRLFGSKAREVTGQGIQGTFNSSGFSGQSFTNWLEKGGLFRSDKSGTVNGALSANVTNQFSAGLQAVKDSTVKYAKVLGLASDTIDGYSKDIKLTLTKDEAQNQKLITDLFGSIGDEMANLVTNLSQFAIGTETSSATLQRLAGEYKAVDNILDVFGKTSQQAFGAVGLASMKAREQLIAFAGGLDALQTSSAYFIQNFFSEAERMAPAIKSVDQAMTDLGYSGIHTKEQFKGIVLGLNLATESGAKMYAALMNIAPAFADVANYVSDLSSKNLDDSLGALSRAIDAEKTKLQTDYDAQVKAIKDKTDLDTKAAETELKLAQDTSSALESIYNSLGDSLKTLRELDRAQAQGILKSALSFANSGGSLGNYAQLTDALQAVAKPSEDLFSTFLDYQRDQVKTANVVAALKDKAGEQLDSSKLTVDAINGTIDAINNTSTAQLTALDTQHLENVARLDGILSSAQNQVDLLKGIDNSILSVSDALGKFNNQPAIAATSAITNAYQSSLGRAPEAAGLAHWQNQVAGGASISSVTSAIANSREAQIDNLYSSLLGRAPDAAGLQYWFNSGLGIDQIKQNFLGSAEYKSLPKFDTGIDYVPYDMVAQIHKGEKIFTAADNNELMNRLKSPQANNEAMVQEIKYLRQCVEDLKAIVATGNTDNYEVVKIVRKWDGEGTPAERETK